MHKWVHSKCYSYYGSNTIHLHTHTPLSTTEWVYIKQTLKLCINVLIVVECYSPFVVSPCSQYRSYKANFCGLSTTLNFFKSALITSCVVVSLKQSNDYLITSRYNKQVHSSTAIKWLSNQHDPSPRIYLITKILHSSGYLLKSLQLPIFRELEGHHYNTSY
jgi:hypothetical protein